MKLKDSEKSILIVILGIAVLALCFIYVAKPNYEAMQGLETECVALRDRLADLQRKEADRDKYEAGIVEFEDAFEERMSGFAPDLNQEVSIMFIQGIKDNNDFDVSSLGLGEPEQFYTLGLNGSDATLGDTATGTAQTTTEAGTTEAATTEAAAEAGAALQEGEAELDESGYYCYRADFPIAYSGSYESLKDVIDYISNYSYRMTINEINISYAADTERYDGNLNLKCYAIMGPDRPENSVELNDVETGKDNIFRGDGVSTSSGAELNKYDENDGAAIESNYDFYAMLNPASSDVSAKVVGQNGTGKEGTVISNSDNDVTTLSYDFYEKDGKNYCKYTLANSTEYEAEVTSAEDIKLLIQSSARKGDDDKVGVRVTIRNTTSIPVYVKITGDDSVSPRVNIASKSGAVKVY